LESVKFKKGDVVECIDPSDSRAALTMGGIYVVATDEEQHWPWRYISLVGVSACCWKPTRFRLHVAPAKTAKFKQGDRVECIDTTGIWLDKNRLYTVKEVAGREFVALRLVEYPGTMWAAYRFIHADAAPVKATSAVLPTGSLDRKGVPMARGCLDYFPAALAAVAQLSKAGNDKHNPGQELHHSRGKSNDHADCIVRHLMDRGTVDPEDGIRHSVKVAWRALALCQQEIEEAGEAPLARGAKL
jgi:hypothetical protein